MMITILIVLLPIYTATLSWPYLCEDATITYGKDNGDMSISPQVASFSAWSDAAETFRGSFAVEVDQRVMPADKVQKDGILDTSNLKNDLRDVMFIENFATGGTGRGKVPGFLYHNPVYGRYRSTLTFTGQFAVEVDGENYPFDEQTVVFKIGTPKTTWGYYRGMALFCSYQKYSSQKCTAYNKNGEELAASDPLYTNPVNMVTINTSNSVHRTVLEMNKKALGFTWDALVCELQPPTLYADGIPISNNIVPFECPVTTSIHCSMKGRRDWQPVLHAKIVPGSLVILSSYVSFRLPVSLAMPRIGTTMIAMLAFMNYMTSSVNSDIPRRGTSIITFFYGVGVMVLFVNLLGHVMTLRFPALAGAIGDSLDFIVAPAFMVSLASCLQMKAYPGFPSEELTTTLFAMSIIFLIVGVGVFISARRNQLINYTESMKSRSEETNGHIPIGRNWDPV